MNEAVPPVTTIDGVPGAVRIRDRVIFHDLSRPPEDDMGEVLCGLKRSPRRIAPKYFYDSIGAALFDRITELPEYYLTRLEREIYRQYGLEIAAAVGPRQVLIEPGSGSSDKIRLLLDALRPGAYVPLDITRSHLLRAAEELAVQFPWLQVHAVRADYSDGVILPDSLPARSRLVFFPGSTIGNFEPPEAERFLGHLRAACEDDGALLIGVDLVKDAEVLHAAYNDAAMVTAEFNLNVLQHVNRVAEADFDTDAFRHVAYFNAAESRVEMHLESLRDQQVRLADESIRLVEGERIHTENSYKYGVRDFHALAQQAGFEPVDTWCDARDWFSVHLLRAA